MTFNYRLSVLVTFALFLIVGVPSLAYPLESKSIAASRIRPIIIRGDDLAARYAGHFPVRRTNSDKCSDLSIEQAQQMPGFDKITQFAKDHWGDGSHQVVTNPSDFPSDGASACIDDTSIQIDAQGDPQCDTQQLDTTTTSGNVTGSNSATITTGDETQGSWTISQTSEFATDVSFNAGFSIPDVFNAGVSVSSSSTFSNTKGDTFTTTQSNTQEVDSTIDTPANSVCTNSLTVQTCRQQGSGKIRVAATGFIWFNFDDSVADSSDPDGGKHFKWAASIDAILSEDERSSFIEFDGEMTGTSKGVDNRDCQPL